MSRHERHRPVESLPAKADDFVGFRDQTIKEKEVSLVPKPRDYRFDDLYITRTSRIAMIDPTRHQNNMKNSAIQEELDLEANKRLAKMYLDQITGLSHPLDDPAADARRRHSIDLLNGLWMHAEYTVAKDRIRLMLKNLIHHSTVVIPMLTPHKEIKKQWSYVTYKRFMASKEEELLFETQAMNHWPARIPWTTPFDLANSFKENVTTMSQRIQSLFTQILYNVPHTWNNRKLMKLLDLGRTAVFTFQRNENIPTLGNEAFDYPETSIRTGIVFEGEKEQEQEVKKDGKNIGITKTRRVKFEVVVGWLDANVCYAWHNPATNTITRNAIHKSMGNLFTHKIYNGDQTENLASVFAGVSVKITEYKPVTVPEQEHIGEAKEYGAQCHVLCLRPFGGPDHCHVSNIYFKNKLNDSARENSIFGILNTSSENETETLHDNSEYSNAHHSIQPYVMQDRAKLAEHQLMHINVKAHNQHWILAGRKLDIKKRISKLLDEDTIKPEQLLQNFKAARITFQDWDLLVSTMTDNENTAHTVITAVNYPHHHSHFPSLGSSFHCPVNQKKKHSDIIKLPEGVWYEIRYVSGSLDELKGDSNGHTHSVFFWDFEKDREGTTLIQNKIHEIKKQMYKELQAMIWPLNTPFHEALLTNGSFLELWQRLVRKMIFSLMKGQVQFAIHKAEHGEPPSVSLTLNQGLFFSIPEENMINTLKAAGEDNALLEVYKIFCEKPMEGTTFTELSQSYDPDKARKKSEYKKERGRQAGSNHTSRNSSQAGSNAPSRDSSRGRDSRGSSQAQRNTERQNPSDRDKKKRERSNSSGRPYKNSRMQGIFTTPSNVWQQSGQKIRLQARHEVPGSISLSSQPRLEENNAILLKELLRRLDNQT
jgi:hypothetical protein